MKRKIYFLALLPIFLSGVGCKQNKPMDNNNNIDVIIISGQSNAVGCTKSYCIPYCESLGQAKYDEYNAGYPSVKMAYECWTKDPGEAGGYNFYVQNSSPDNEFVKVKLGQGNGSGTFGPEIGIAEAFVQNSDRNLYIIKIACGASNLKNDWAARNSRMYPFMIDYIETEMLILKNEGYNPIIKAFCWMQGEGDAWDGLYQVYKSNLELFVGNIREDLAEYTGNKELPFIDAGISSASQWQYYRQVNEAKRQFAEESPNNYFIDTIAEGLHTNQEPADAPDEAHYDSESQVQLGHLFYEHFKQFLKK